MVKLKKFEHKEMVGAIGLAILLISISYRTIVPEPLVFAANLSGLFFVFAVRRVGIYIKALLVLVFYIFFKNTFLVSEAAIIMEAVRIFVVTIPYALILLTSSDCAKLLRRFVIFSLPIPIIGFAGLYNISIPFIDVSTFLYSRGGGENVRAASIFLNPNYYGAFLYSCIVIWMALAMHLAKRESRLYFLILLLLFAGGMFSFSRAFQGAAALLLPGVIMIGVSQRNHQARYLFLPIIFLFSVPAAVFLLRSGIAFDLTARWIADGGGVDSRLKTIEQTLNIANQSVVKALFGSGARVMTLSFDHTFEAHNSILRIFGEYGLVFLLFFIAFVVASIFPRKIRRKRFLVHLSLLSSYFFMLATNDFYLLREFWLCLFSVYYLDKSASVRHLTKDSQRLHGVSYSSHETF